MIINEHSKDLDRSDGTGNGYHGRCLYCGLALVTDLGYCSWEGSKCIDREIVNYNDIPINIKKYAYFRGYSFDQYSFKYVKPYSNEEYTIDQIDSKLNSLN